MKTEFNFKNWLKTMGVTLLALIVMSSIPNFPLYLMGWFCCMVYEYSHAYFTNTKLKYVPKDKVTDDMV